MELSHSDLGKYLRVLRKEKGKTLHQVSREIDLDSPLISKIERGKRLPTAEQIKKLSNYFNIPESELRIKVTAQKIIKDFGVNNTTFAAINLVMEQITPYIKK